MHASCGPIIGPLGRAWSTRGAVEERLESGELKAERSGIVLEKLRAEI